jgi:hypothetical protein
MMKCVLILNLITINAVSAFILPVRNGVETRLFAEKKGFFGKFFEELDSFVDDATNRRLGNGAAFYGKRKSAFYGEEDFMKKDDNEVSDPTEDYNGPKKAGYFTWMPDENGQLRPVTRMRGKNIERNPKLWADEEE